MAWRIPVTHPHTPHPAPAACPGRSICPLVWFAVAATAAPYARHICAAPALSSPAAQRAAHSLYQMASWLGYSPLPVALLVQPSAADECVTLMVALQFGAGALVPLLANAVGEARLFQHHQRQRWLARLPLERGAQAEAYDWIWCAAFLGPGSAAVCCLRRAGQLVCGSQARARRTDRAPPSSASPPPGG